jgi:anaphase-promoting complex subunit 8
MEINASDNEACYSLGQTYEMLNLYQYALFYYKKCTALRPHDSRYVLSHSSSKNAPLK